MKKILIIEDVQETSQWLGAIAAAAFPGCEVSHADSIAMAMAKIERDIPDIALVDLRLPDGSGVEVLSRLTASPSDVLCVVTTVMGDDASIVAALAAGASGYILKEQPAERIARQLSQLAEGIPALSPSIARRIMKHFRHTGPTSNEEVELTEREREVLAFIGRGFRNIDVAKQIGVAEGTVASHLKSIYRKLGISSRAEAAWHAICMGLRAD